MIPDIDPQAAEKRETAARVNIVNIAAEAIKAGAPGFKTVTPDPEGQAKDLVTYALTIGQLFMGYVNQPMQQSKSSLVS